LASIGIRASFSGATFSSARLFYTSGEHSEQEGWDIFELDRNRSGLADGDRLGRAGARDSLKSAEPIRGDSTFPLPRENAAGQNRRELLRRLRS